jgi:hypothetical protein
MFKLNKNAEPFRPSNRVENTKSKIVHLNKNRSNQNSIVKEKDNNLSNLDNKSNSDNSKLKNEYSNKNSSNQNSSILKDKSNHLSNSDNKSKLDNSNKRRWKEEKIDENSNKNIINNVKSKKYFKRDNYRSYTKVDILHNEKILIEYNDYPSAMSVFKYLDI